MVGQLPLGKSDKFTKTTFYYLKVSENNVCVVVVTRKLVNLEDGEEIKVPCSLQFTAEEKSIKVIKDTLETLLKHAVIKTKKKLSFFPLF